MRHRPSLLDLGSPLSRWPILLATLVIIALVHALDGAAGAGAITLAVTVGVTSAGKAAERWSRRSASAQTDYESGVRDTPRSWAAASAAADASYRAGVTAAAGRGAYAKGIQDAGDAKWKRGATEKGPGRYAEGVSKATGDYGKAIGPVLEVIARTDLPPRGPVGSESNYTRATTMAKALRGLRAK